MEINGPDKVGKPAKFWDPYTGRVYHWPSGGGGPLEVLPMAFEPLLGDDRVRFSEIWAKDPALARLALGLLFNWKP